MAFALSGNDRDRSRFQGKVSHVSLVGSTTGSTDSTSEIIHITPTHEISKAEKRENVHASEVPGCSKVNFQA